MSETNQESIYQPNQLQIVDDKFTQTNGFTTYQHRKNNKIILSEGDERKFNEYLVRNQQFKLTHRTQVFSFPKYFGTNEDEFTKYRKNALINRRLKNNPDYPKEKPMKKKVQPKKQIITEPKSVVVNNSTMKAPIVESEKKVIEPNQLEPEPVANTQTTTGINGLSTKPPTKEEGPTQETLSSFSSPSDSKETTPTPAVTPMTPPISTPSAPMRWNMVVQKSLPKTAKTNGSTPGSPSPGSPSNNLANPLDMSPSLIDPASSLIPLDNSPKQLGTVLIRILYDRQLLSSTIAKNKNQLVSPHGLTNTGSICYMNAVLQLLFACEPFTQFLNIIRNYAIGTMNSSTSKTPIMDAILILHDSFKKKAALSANGTTENSPDSNTTSINSNGNSNSKNFDVLNPLPFYTAISKLKRFSHLKWGRQEDAEEFLGYLLDGLHEEFVGSINDLSIVEITKITDSITDKTTLANVTNAIELIKETKISSLSASNSAASGNDDDSWLEVGSNRKIAVKRTVEVKPSPIVQLFGGQFRSVLQIPNKKSSITLDPFMHVQLDISDNNTVDLISAFNKFSEVEDISYGSSSAKKQNFIDKLPNILIIHLKRFSFVTNDDKNIEEDDYYEVVSSSKQKKKNQQNSAAPASSPVVSNKSNGMFEGSGRIEKLHKIVKYTHLLTLPPSCISSQIQEEPHYKLIGVVYHHGRTTDGGHYTSDVLDSSSSNDDDSSEEEGKKKNADQWIRVDDTQVSLITSDMVIENGISGGSNLDNSKSAYILMYQRI